MSVIDVRNFRLLIISYVVCCEIILTNTRTSTLWKLNADETKVVQASLFHKVQTIEDGLHYKDNSDAIFNIITSTVHDGNSWIKGNGQYYCTDCNNLQLLEDKHNTYNNSSRLSSKVTAIEDEVLDCGKPVNFTYYDNLVGVLNRNKHPNVADPQATQIFNKIKKNTKGELDIDALEKKLKKAKREKPKSVQLYNQIGNFWRIKGNSQRAIECFRRALAVSPHNADVLLNLARVLFALQYLDDAIYLTRRSIELQAHDKSTWQQYFTLGEIFRAYGHYQEASIHLKRALELKPGFEPALHALKEMENMPADSIHVYTLVIIICLVLGVLLVILSSVDSDSGDSLESKPQRHFNKAMAMKTLRGLSIKHSRNSKKVNF